MSGDVGRRALAVLVLLTLFVLAALAARRGWRARARAQADVAEPPGPPAGLVPPAAAVPALYVSSTRAGAWLDRVTAHGLGVRADARVRVCDGPGGRGVLVERAGAPPLWVDAAALRAVRRDAGIAGKVTPGAELVVLTWDCGDATLDTGLRPRHRAERESLVASVGALLAGDPDAGGSGGPGGPGWSDTAEAPTRAGVRR